MGTDDISSFDVVAYPKSVAPQQTVDITVALTAPAAAGSYLEKFKFKNNYGVSFGVVRYGNPYLASQTPIWVAIKVAGTPSTKALTLTTSANPSTYNQVGQQITYTYVIKNTGNSTLGPAQFTVSDNLIGPINCGPGNTTLAPNATVTCTATYTISQADLTVASITNSATASGGGAGPSQSASATISKATTVLLSLAIAPNPSTYSQAGQTITYTYVIKNSGNTNLGPAQFTVSDNLVGSINCGDANTTLAPNATVTCTATYTISEADLTVASIINSATASGGGAGPSQSASATFNKQ